MAPASKFTLKELLELVTVKQNPNGSWNIIDVKGTVFGDVWGIVFGTVRGHVYGDVDGHVGGKINGREWQFVETPKDKLKRLIEESGNEELIEAFNQLEDN